MPRPFTFDRVVRLSLTAVAVGVALWLLYYLRNVLLPFGIAVVIAYMCEPMVQFFRRRLHTKGRALAVFITLFCVGTLVAVIGALFIPSIVSEMRQLGDFIKDYLRERPGIPFIPESLQQLIMQELAMDRIADWLLTADWEQLGQWVTALLSQSVNMVIEVFNWAMVLLYVIFVMIDYEKIQRGFKLMVPPRYRRTAYGVWRDVERSMNHYFRGQSLIAFSVGVLFSIGFLLMGLPLAVVLGLTIGILNMVPYLQLTSIPVTALLCGIMAIETGQNFWILAAEAAAVYIVVQAIQDLILTPRVMGKAMGLNPAVILLSLSVWGALLGLLGMIIALPLTTLLISYYERYVLQAKP